MHDLDCTFIAAAFKFDLNACTQIYLRLWVSSTKWGGSRLFEDLVGLIARDDWSFYYTWCVRFDTCLKQNGISLDCSTAPKLVTSVSISDSMIFCLFFARYFYFYSFFFSRLLLLLTILTTWNSLFCSAICFRLRVFIFLPSLCCNQMYS